MEPPGRFEHQILPRKVPVDRQIAALANRQYTIVDRGDLRRLGLSARAIGYRMERGLLHPLYPGVYSVGHGIVPVRGRLLAAARAAGPRAVLSHQSAGFLWDLTPLGSRFHVLAPGRSRRSKANIVVHRVRALAPEEHGTIDGIPVTSLARMLLDIATGRYLGRAWDEAWRRQLLDIRQVHAVLGNNPRHPGRRPLERLIEDTADPPPDIRSELERLLWELVLEEGLRRPQTNVAIGPYVVDAYWPHAKLVVELDGRTFHERRRAFEEDRERDAYLLAEHGISTYRITWQAITRRRATVVSRLQGLTICP